MPHALFIVFWRVIVSTTTSHTQHECLCGQGMSFRAALGAIAIAGSISRYAADLGLRGDWLSAVDQIPINGDTHLDGTLIFSHRGGGDVVLS